MTFHRHNPAPAVRALTDDASVAEALDLFVPFEARAAGALLVLVCDHESRPLLPLLIEDLGTMPVAAMPRMLEQLAGQVLTAHLQLPEGVFALVAIARRGALHPTGIDRRWVRAIREAFRDRVPIRAVHLITFDGSMPLPEPRQAA